MVLILYMVILIPAGVLVNSVTDEKKNRVLEVLMASVSPKQLLTGKITALGLVGLLEAAVWLGVLWFVVGFGGQALAIPEGFTIPTSLIVWSFVFFMLGYAIYGSQLAAVGALASDVKETRSANLLVMAPMIFSYMFMIFIFESPDSPVAITLSLFPLTSPIAMIARLVTTDVPVWQPILAALILVISVIFTVRLTARMFRAQVLLSGQPFSAKGYYKTLLGRAS
jgi:ABC-2 type transport system permease protein